MTARDVKEVVMGITQDDQFIGNLGSPITNEHIAFMLSILKAAKRMSEFTGITGSIIQSIEEQIQTIENSLTNSEPHLESERGDSERLKGKIIPQKQSQMISKQQTTTF